MAKLEKNKVITEKEFRIYLKKIRRIEDFNKFYTTTEDGLSNRVATYIQALGRVERVWEKMDNQVIRLEREVYNHLEDFATQEDNWRNFEKNKPYFSQNVGDMFTQIIENKLGREQRQRHYQWEGLKDINERCRTEIQKLLSKLNLVRANKITPEKAKQIRQEWQDLRELALKQSFSKYEENTLLKDYYCTFETDDYDHRNKCLWIQKDTQNIVPYEVNPDSSFYSWTLDAIYQNITNNSVLRGHFDLNHYEQGFSGKGHYFTPYFYQSILAGAIGEEAVKAIFEKENINLSSDEIDNTLFELIDLKVESKAWYIDAKNYSEQTITHFQLDETDYFYHPKLNQENFKGKAQVKLAKINQFHENSSDCKIIYINAFGNSERPTHYYDENFNDIGINFQKAKIIIIQSMLKTGKSVRGDRNYSQDFQHFISELKNN